MSSLKLRAGKVSYNAATKTATALPAQGQITIKPSLDDDSFFSFEWSPKESVVSIEKDEFLIIPGDVTWTRVEECKTGRVFALEFLSSGARYLFWMQEVNDNDDDASELSKKDEEISQKIKSLVERADDDEEEEEEDTREAPADSAQALDVSQGLHSLGDLLSSENVIQALERANDEDLQRLYALLPPEIKHTRENLSKVLQSSYFKQGAANLSEALFSGGAVISRALGVEYRDDGVTPYINAVKDQTRREKKEKEQSEEKK